MKLAYLIAVLIGAVIGFFVGWEFLTSSLRDEGALDAYVHANAVTPFLRAGGLFACIGALIAAGIVYILRATRGGA